jgi:hypothetical protein
MDPDETRRHIDTVAARIQAIAPPDLRDPLLRATETHEVEPVPGFGEIWRPDRDLDDYVRRHTGRLRALLLFELAHEGAATHAMRAAAARGGIAGEFANWETRLRTSGRS